MCLVFSSDVIVCNKWYWIRIFTRVVQPKPHRDQETSIHEHQTLILNMQVCREPMETSRCPGSVFWTIWTGFKGMDLSRSEGQEQMETWKKIDSDSWELEPGSRASQTEVQDKLTEESVTHSVLEINTSGAFYLQYLIYFLHAAPFRSKNSHKSLHVSINRWIFYYFLLLLLFKRCYLKYNVQPTFSRVARLSWIDFSYPTVWGTLLFQHEQDFINIVASCNLFINKYFIHHMTS